MMRTHTRKMGEIASEVPPQGAKSVLFLCYECNVAFPSLILHRFRPFFETTDMNRFPHAYIGEK